MSEYKPDTRTQDMEDELAQLRSQRAIDEKTLERLTRENVMLNGVLTERDTLIVQMRGDATRLREAVTEAHWIIVVLIRALEFSIPRSEMNSTLARVQDWLDKYGKE